MTDNQIIETLKNIKNNCKNIDCIDCTFLANESKYPYTCKIRQLMVELDTPPNKWDIEKLERIIKQ